MLLLYYGSPRLFLQLECISITYFNDNNLTIIKRSTKIIFFSEHKDKLFHFQSTRMFNL